ncbi:glutaminase family protein [Echinicola rosea]|uniref:Glutaminase n=1 Tax=Echinicola rosea TaxID=1807691 RepID=A0ABQ1V4P3_9BACT|nr:glutaminase family protein [Echinicola rosea]GGF38073.1 glutaminase [Echinicola rosea]
MRSIKRVFALITLGFGLHFGQDALAQDALRAPAYPLITHNPNFSIWSMGDELNNSSPKHWTTADQGMLGLIKVDGEIYRFLGKEKKQYSSILPTSDEADYQLSYTETQPGNGWFLSDFDDQGWKSGKAPFTDQRKEGGTFWNTDELWLRREFDLDDVSALSKLNLKIRHDDNIMVYLNGEQIYELEGWIHRFSYVAIPKEVQQRLQEEDNVLAVHIKNTAGGRWLDVGLAEEKEIPAVKDIQTAPQKSVSLSATQTKYSFDCGGIGLDVTFTSPLLMDDLDLMARPISYITTATKSTDGNSHEVEVYLGVSSDIAVHQPYQEVAADQYSFGSLDIMKVGTTEQNVLGRKGDDVRIDWGHAYVAVSDHPQAKQWISTAQSALESIANATFRDKKLKGKSLVLNSLVNLGMVGDEKQEQVFLVGYDEETAIQLFGENLLPWWKTAAGGKFESQLVLASEDYPEVMGRCEAFDQQLHSEALKAGGQKYADMCVLAYRQAIAAHTLVEGPRGELLFLSKENNSNGSINTVDVTYPSAPLFLRYNPDLMEGMLNGIFFYSESGRWKKPFPAHDLGTYPIANGQTYGEDMPVEEAGNMLLLTAAIVHQENDAAYAKAHWEVLTLWAEYLRKSGFDPANQLSTDDFAGHLARNANLSVKAILALAAYGKMAGMQGMKEVEEDYITEARGMAKQWMKLAADGDHYSLAFERPGTWSQKYNLVWDEILDLGVFPEEVADKEVAYYLTKQEKYGLPLDSRKTYTKSDWVFWSASLADSHADFEALIDPMWKYANETANRVPISDWHETKDAHVMNFRARSVVGGYFIQLLYLRGAY